MPSLIHRVEAKLRQSKIAKKFRNVGQQTLDTPPSASDPETVDLIQRLTMAAFGGQTPTIIVLKEGQKPLGPEQLQRWLTELTIQAPMHPRAKDK